MKKIVDRSNSRGSADYGWLKTNYSFSFSNYFNPNKMGFGLLRVLNDDTIEGGKGFGTHPHDNMEIVTIMLEGALEHKDSMGSGSVIKPGEVQAMSAGSGILHSEFNHSEKETAKLLQLWIMTKDRDIQPRYDQKKIGEISNGIKTVVSGKKNEDVLYIHQDASISMGKAKAGDDLKYKMQFPDNGIYLFVLDGSIKFDNDELNARDAVGIYDTDEVVFNATSDTNFIIIDVPMN